jgi:hypothetical protein
MRCSPWMPGAAAEAAGSGGRRAVRGRDVGERGASTKQRRAQRAKELAASGGSTPRVAARPDPRASSSSRQRRSGLSPRAVPDGVSCNARRPFSYSRPQATRVDSRHFCIARCVIAAPQLLQGRPRLLGVLLAAPEVGGGPRETRQDAAPACSVCQMSLLDMLTTHARPQVTRAESPEWRGCAAEGRARLQGALAAYRRRNTWSTDHRGYDLLPRRRYGRGAGVLGSRVMCSGVQSDHMRPRRSERRASDVRRNEDSTARPRKLQARRVPDSGLEVPQAGCLACIEHVVESERGVGLLALMRTAVTRVLRRRSSTVRRMLVRC